MGTPGDTNEVDAVPLIRWRRWLPFFGIALVAFVLWQVDRRMKASSSPGFALADAQWVIAADDVGAVWDGVLKTDTWASLRSDLGDPSRDVLVAFRKDYGIRLSPQRWNTWLGDGATLSGNESGWLLVTRPGLLMRAGMRVRRGTFSGENGGHSFGWRDGYLCISDSEAVLSAALDGEGEPVKPVGIRDGLRVSIPEFHDTEVTLFGRKGIPLEGSIALAMDSVPGGLSLRDAGGVEVLQVASATPEPVIEVLREILPDWPNLRAADEMLDAWFERLPEGWRGRKEESVWALDGFAVPAFSAVPLMEQVKLSVAPAESDAVFARPIEHDGFTGFCEPWYGHEYERCVISDGVLQRMSNTAMMVERKSERWEFGALDEADVRVELNLLGAVREGGPIVREAAARGYVEGWNADDVQRFIDTFTRRVQRVGPVVLTGEAVDDRVAFVGLLDARDE